MVCCVLDLCSKKKTVYYLAIVGDFILRFTWALTLFSPNRFNLFLDNLIYFLELLRRFAWTAFRIENEHLNNTIGYRTVDFVPLYFYEEEEKEIDSSNKNSTTVNCSGLRIFLTVFIVILVSIYSLQVYEPEVT